MVMPINRPPAKLPDTFGLMRQVNVSAQLIGHQLANDARAKPRVGQGARLWSAALLPLNAKRRPACPLATKPSALTPDRAGNEFVDDRAEDPSGFGNQRNIQPGDLG